MITRTSLLVEALLGAAPCAADTSALCTSLGGFTRGAPEAGVDTLSNACAKSVQIACECVGAGNGLQACVAARRALWGRLVDAVVILQVLPYRRALERLHDVIGISGPEQDRSNVDTGRLGLIDEADPG